MCINCWKEYESPAIVNEKTERAVELIEEVYEYSSVGGTLHVALDDWNLDNVEWCLEEIKQAMKEGEKSTYYDPFFHDPEDFQARLAAELECAEHLLTMTVEEVASALAKHDGYF